MKKFIFFFLMVSFTFVACDLESTDSGNHTKVTDEPVENTQSNWLAIPNKQVGLISAKADEAAIIKAYGKENVTRKEVGVGEGQMTLATIVFPNTANELIIEWQDEFSFQKISRIRIEQDSSDWMTEEGIRIGTTLEELVTMNGKDFNFYGFEWDGSGAIYDWDHGKVNPQLVAFLVPENPEPIYPDLLGSETFSSSNPKAKEAKLVVATMIIHFGL